MKTILAALSAILALTAFTGEAAAGSRHHDRDAVIIVDDRDGDWRRNNHDWRQNDRDWRRNDRHWRDGRREENYREVLSERRVVRRLIRQGFVSVENIDLRRDRYIVEAVRPNGALVRLAVDAYDGEILARERIGWVGGGRGGPGRGWGGQRGGAGFEFDLGGGSFGLYSR